eukprot:301968_1
MDTMKLLVDGYIRMIENSIIQTIPYPINEICFQFYYRTNKLVCKNANIDGLFFVDFDLNITDLTIKTHESWKCDVYHLNQPNKLFNSNDNNWKASDMGLLYNSNVIYSKSICNEINNSYNKLNIKHINYSNSYHTIFQCGGRGNPYCCAMILNPIEFSNKNEINYTMSSFNLDLPKYPKPINASKLLYSNKYGLLSIGGAYGTSFGLKYVYKLDLNDDNKINNISKWKWEILFEMKYGRIAPSAVMISENKLVIMIGYGSPSYTNTVEMYDLENKQLIQLSNTNKKRSDATALYDNKRNKIYLGGGDTTDASMIIEQYDIYKNIWSMNDIPKLKTRYFTRPFLWMENNNILAIGCKQSVDFIDLRLNNKKWKQIVFNVKDSFVQSVYGDIVPKTSKNTWKFIM